MARGVISRGGWKDHGVVPADIKKLHPGWSRDAGVLNNYGVTI